MAGTARRSRKSVDAALADLIRRSTLSESCVGKARSFVPGASERRWSDWIEDTVDALGVGGPGLAGRRRPAASRSGRFQRERDEAERLGLWAA